ncbi:hypothetical protein BDR05DRAFT_972736 [Suillus weaverae]|nr:hypothetical protein BDR05DRAFT_972736 [Suillus weaverae]
MDGTYGEAQGEVDCEMEWHSGVGGGTDSDEELDDGIPAKPEWEPPMPDPAGDWPQAQENEINQHGGDDAANARYSTQLDDKDNIYFPFCSQTEWEIARWAKLCGPSSTAFTDLLAIDSVAESLGLSFKNTKELNAIIDHELPTGCLKFKHKQIIVTREAFNVYYHDVIKCVKALYGDPNFAEHLTFALEQHYADEDQTTCLFHDMHTGKGTIIPIIISMDKTQAAYLVYLMIGNIPKEIHCKPSRGAHILLGYLPMTRLKHISNKASHHHTMANLYHACMSCILAPLKSVGLDGVKMCSGDGALQHCHPLFACFLLTTGIKFGECPKCDVDANETGNALAALDQGNLNFVHACAAAGIKPIIHPFWEDLPFSNIFHMCCFLLGVIINIRLPNNLNASRLLRAVRGLLDFLYLTQYPCHSSETLELLQEVLDVFHDNKDIFIDLGIQNSFNLPKLHTTHHYPLMIAMFGTTDNYNTEYTERLHINLAKDAYCATNHKDKFVMTKHPSAKAISMQKLVEDYGATYFREALAHYIARHNGPDNNQPLQRHALNALANDIHFPFCTLPIFHKIKWLSSDTHGHGEAPVTVDSVHA